MPLFDAALLRRFHCWWLLARRAGRRGLPAGPRRRLPAGGTAAIGVRDYTPGDDYRYIDWHWCARRDELLTRLFPSEDRYTSILLDCSPSMRLGRPSKFQLARQIAAALGYVSLLGGDCLRVAAFSATVVAELPPLGGKAEIARLLHFLEHLPLQGKQTDLARTAEGLRRRGQRRGPVVVLSDFYDPAGFQRGLGTLLAGGYEPHVVQIYEPRETYPGPLGEVELVDIETGAVRRVAITAQDLARHEQHFAEFCQSIRRWCAKWGITCIQLPSDTPPPEALLAVLQGGK
jgi:uncharacterized protein (DUF58 family)